MRLPGTRAIRSSLASALAARPRQAEPRFSVAYEFTTPHGAILTACGPEGQAALLITATAGSDRRGFATRGLRVEGPVTLDVDLRGERSSCEAIVITCLDAELLDAFAALGADLANGLASAEASPGAVVSAILSRWSALFTPSRDLTAMNELGLWGEIWTLHVSSKPDALLEAWHGGDAGVLDFFIGGGCLEVKTSRAPGIHHVSHSQSIVDNPEAFLFSLAVERASDGLTLGSLVRGLAARLTEPRRLFEGIADRGLSLATLDAASTPYALLTRPSLYRLDDVPRVRQADAGVTELRYTVSLHAVAALEDDALRAALTTFGLAALAAEG